MPDSSHEGGEFSPPNLKLINRGIETGDEDHSVSALNAYGKWLPRNIGTAPDIIIHHKILSDSTSKGKAMEAEELIDQPRANPTRKLSAAVLGAAMMAVAGLIVKNAAPGWYDPEVFAALTPVVIFALGYYVRDRPNVVVSE